MEIAGVELPEEATEGTTQEERVASWFGMTKRMTDTLQALLGSPVYGRGVEGRDAAPQTHGVYLFSESGEHLYVGRTGRTERSVKSGKTTSSGFRKRLAGHSTPGATISSASFAMRIAIEAAETEGLVLPAARNERVEQPRFAELFSEAKKRVTAMEFRTVEIEVDRESAVFEVTPRLSWLRRTTHSRRAEFFRAIHFSPRLIR